ncbi:hypothetical protein HK104_010141 [Borealophlyctis nickersoniae]|nr:hypothetical protein HK104_010141 [Borealophlyctis nickersoniae]
MTAPFHVLRVAKYQAQSQGFLYDPPQNHNGTPSSRAAGPSFSPIPPPRGSKRSQSVPSLSAPSPQPPLRQLLRSSARPRWCNNGGIQHGFDIGDVPDSTTVKYPPLRTKSKLPGVSRAHPAERFSSVKQAVSYEHHSTPDSGSTPEPPLQPLQNVDEFIPVPSAKSQSYRQNQQQLEIECASPTPNEGDGGKQLRQWLASKLSDEIALLSESVLIASAGGEGEGSSGVPERVPLVIAYQSETIKHIHEASASFRERAEGILKFPTISATVMCDVITFLYHSWYASSRVIQTHNQPCQPDTPGMPNQALGDDSTVPTFSLNVPHILELLDAAVYLDLSNLADLCAKVAAERISDITSFGGLAAPLIRSILKRLSIGDLCLCEHRLITPAWRTGNNRNVELDLPVIDTKPIWIRNYLKLSRQLSHSSSFRKSMAKVDWTMARKQCVKFYIEQCMHQLSHPAARSKLLKVLEIEAEGISELQMAITGSNSAVGEDEWGEAFAALSNLSTVRISVAEKGDMSHLLTHLVASKCRDIELQVPVASTVPAADVVWLSSKSAGSATNLEKSVGQAPQNAREVRLGVSCRLDVSNVRGTGSTFPCGKHAMSQDHSGFSAALDGSNRFRLTIMQDAEALPWSTTRLSLLTCAAAYPLTELSLSGTHLGTEGATTISEFISQSDICCWKHLDLSNTDTGSLGICAVLKSLASNAILTHLNVSHNISKSDPHSTEAGKSIGSILKSDTHRLRELDISFNNFTAVGLLAITTALGENSQMEMIGMAGLDLGPCVRNMVERTKSGRGVCRRFRLGDNQLLPRSMVELIEIWAQGRQKNVVPITELDLSRNMFDDYVGSALSSLLKSKQCRLVRLDLVGAEEDGFVFGDQGCAMLLKALWGNRSLKYLNLSHQYFAAEGSSMLAQTLPGCALEEVVLQHNLMGNVEVGMLEKAAERMSEMDNMKRRVIVVDLAGNLVSAGVLEQLKNNMYFNESNVMFLG